MASWVFSHACNEIAVKVIQLLEQAGLSVQRSFDLKAAREHITNCSCPYHGTETCDCQMVVLLVYQEENDHPVTLLFHGHDNQTWINLDIAPHTQAPQFTQQIINNLQKIQSHKHALL